MASLAEKRLFLLDMDGTFYLGDRIIEGVNRLNVSADRLLQAFKLSADLLCVGALARFNN